MPGTPARVLDVRHAPFAQLAAARAAFAECALDVRHADLGDDLPEGLDDFDGLVVLGGPQSAYSDTGFPTRGRELALLRAALEQTVPTFGICLGAQLLAVAAGGTGYRGPAAEVGWTPVTFTAAAARDPLGSEHRGTQSVMESHGDHFTLPAAATLLATGTGYRNQAFRVGRAAWGTQFHPEADATFTATRRTLIPGWADDESSPPVDEPAVLATSLVTAATVFGRFAALCAHRAAQPAGGPLHDAPAMAPSAA